MNNGCFDPSSSLLVAMRDHFLHSHFHGGGTVGGAVERGGVESGYMEEEEEEEYMEDMEDMGDMGDMQQVRRNGLLMVRQVSKDSLNSAKSYNTSSSDSYPLLNLGTITNMGGVERGGVERKRGKQLPLLFRRHPELLKKQQYSEETWQKVLLAKFGTLSEKLIAAASSTIPFQTLEDPPPLTDSTLSDWPALDDLPPLLPPPPPPHYSYQHLNQQCQQNTYQLQQCQQQQQRQQQGAMNMEDIKTWLGTVGMSHVPSNGPFTAVPPSHNNNNHMMMMMTKQDDVNKAKRKKKKRSFCDPPRPRNAFIIFRNHYQPILQDLYPNVKMQDLSRLLGQMWKQTEDSVKQEYRRCAFEERQLHKKKYPTFKYHQQSSALHQQQQQQEKV